jgi:hypothetical protein
VVANVERPSQSWISLSEMPLASSTDAHKRPYGIITLNPRSQ